MATTNQADHEWADQQFAECQPNQQAVRAFDASPDGQRYLELTGMTMWENLGGNTLPTDANDAE
jgi:hypothetical protein